MYLIGLNDFKIYSLCLAILLVSSLDVWVRQDLAPEASDLMRVIDLHDVELLNDLLVNLQSSLLEWRHYGLSQVDRDQVMQCIQVLDFFVSLNHSKGSKDFKSTYVFDFVHHGAGVALVFEHGLHCLSTSGNVVKIVLSRSLLFLVLVDLLEDLVLG